MAAPDPRLGFTADQAATNYGVPTDLYRQLIQTESGWNPLAKNPGSSALGLNQFISGTGRDVGLVGTGYDLRTDPTSSLWAGADYLKAQYDRTGSWTAALQAYQGVKPGDALTADQTRLYGLASGYDVASDGAVTPSGTGSTSSLRDWLGKLYGAMPNTNPFMPGWSNDSPANTPAWSSDAFKAGVKTGGGLWSNIENYFERGAIIILGFIFVAVGLSMFAGAPTIEAGEGDALRKLKKV